MEDGQLLFLSWHFLVYDTCELHSMYTHRTGIYWRNVRDLPVELLYTNDGRQVVLRWHRRQIWNPFIQESVRHGSRLQLDCWTWLHSITRRFDLSCVYERPLTSQWASNSPVRGIRFSRHNGAKVEGSWQLMKAILFQGGLCVKITFVWLLITTVYLATFPSLIDACSGYESAVETDFIQPNRSEIIKTANLLITTNAYQYCPSAGIS